MKRVGTVLGCAAIALAALGLGYVIWAYREEILSALGALATLVAIGLFAAWKEREEVKAAEALQRRDAEGVLVTVQKPGTGAIQITRTTVTITQEKRG